MHLGRIASAASGGLIGLPAIAFFIAGVRAPYSPSGWLQLAALSLLALGLLWKRKSKPLLLGALALLLAVAAFRLAAADRGEMKMLTLPAAQSPRWLGRLLDEQDGSLIGAQLLREAWQLRGFDRDRLLPAMRDAYIDMRREHGATSTPAFDTLLGRQSPAAFDAIVIESQHPARAGVIFLHGYAGNYALECWLMSEAREAISRWLEAQEPRPH